MKYAFEKAHLVDQSYAVEINCLLSDNEWLILLIKGQNWIDFVCTVPDRGSPCSQAREGVGVGLEVVRLGLMSQCNCIFMIFVYLPWTQRLSALQDLFLLRIDALIQVHSSSDNCRQNTHLLGHTLLIEARVFPPACKASSCSTYTHSFPSPPPYLILCEWPPGSWAFSETFSHFSFLLLPVWISLIHLWISLFLFMRVHLLINLSLRILLIPFISGLFPQGRKRRKEAFPAQGQEPIPSPFGFHYKQASTL